MAKQKNEKQGKVAKPVSEKSAPRRPRSKKQKRAREIQLQRAIDKFAERVARERMDRKERLILQQELVKEDPKQVLDAEGMEKLQRPRLEAPLRPLRNLL